MNHIAVITDSSSCIPPEVAEKYHIHVAPIHLIIDDVKYRDGIDITVEEFYARLRGPSTKFSLGTSGAMQGEFISIFEKLRGKVEGIVIILLSSKISAAYSAALTVRDAANAPIEIVDSQFTTSALGFIAVAAAQAADQGKNMNEVVAQAKNVMSKVKGFVALENLDYLRRGGRFSEGSAEQAAQMRPVVTMREGLIKLADGTADHNEADEKLLRIMKDNLIPTPLHVAVMHGDLPQKADRLQEKIKARFDCAELWMTPLTPVLGAHSGPDTLGVAFYNE
jgi:DegV family protein with EDD domain